MSEEKKEAISWYCQSNDAWIPLPLSVSRKIDKAARNAKIHIVVKEINQFGYEIIKTSNNCAWQRNTFTNKVRPVIRNIEEVKDETEILNQKDAYNPFAATQKDQKKYLGADYQRFGEILPGDSYVGGEYKWLHCQFMADDQIKDILIKTSKLINNIDHLMDKQWVNPLKYSLADISPLSIEWFKKMIGLYTREGGNMYVKLNWNLRANEWFNIQKVLSPIVFALKCVCEGYCYRITKDEKFKPYEGTVHRVLDYKKSISAQINDINVGDEIYFGGFTSTTKNWKMTNKIAKSRGFVYEPAENGIYLKIKVKAEHKCAVDITDTSEFEYEEEVLISCFTRFRITGIDNPQNKPSYIAVHLESLPAYYTSWKQWESERKVREQLAALAYSYQFGEAVELIKCHKTTIPNLINSTRPDSSKFWTVCHQVRNSGKDVDEWIHKFRGLGYWDGARNHFGETIYNLDQIKKKQESTGCTLM